MTFNIFTLNTMNRKSLTTEQRRVNSKAAAGAHAATYTATYATYAAHAAAAVGVAVIEYWLNRYFEQTGESRADYEAELERDNSFREVG